MNAPPGEARSVLPAVLAAILPLPMLFVSGGLLFLVLGGAEETARAWEAGGAGIYLVMLAAFGAAAVNTALLPLLARGIRVPVVLPLGVALAPWLAGLLGVWWGTIQTAEAITYVNPLDRAIIAAAGLSESSNARIFGAWYSAGQLVAVALGMGLGAVGLDAPGRRFRGALLGLTAVPAAALLVFALSSGGSEGAWVFLSIAVFAVTAVLAGMSAGADAHARSAVLAGAAAIAATGAVAAVSATTNALSVSSLLEALVHVHPAERAALLVAGGAQILQSVTFQWLALGTCAVATLAILSYAARRSGSASRVVLGASVAALAVLLGVGADQAIVNAANTRLSQFMQPPGALTLIGRTLVRFNGQLESPGAHVLLGENGELRFVDGERTSLTSPPGPLMARLRAMTDHPPTSMFGDVDRGRPGSSDEDDTPADLQLHRERLAGIFGTGPGVWSEDEEALLRQGDSLIIAVDERATTSELLQFLQRTQEAGIPSVRIVGAAHSLPAEALQQVTSIIPFAPALVNQEGALLTSLGSAVTPHALSADPIALRAKLDGGEVLSISARPGAPVSPFKITLPAPGRDDLEPLAGLDRGREAVDVPERSLVHLVVVEAAPLGSVLDAIAALGHLGYRTVLHPSGLPAALDVPVAPDEQAPARGVGGIGQPGPVNARGALAKEVIRRVVKRHHPQVVFCYEQALSKNPSLRGQVTLAFEIGAQGNVSEVEVVSSTLRAEGAAEVETCLTQRVGTWSFPRPTGGGSVSVTYPFVFEPSP